MGTRLNNMIAQKKQQGRKLLSIFLTAGFPGVKETVELIHLLEAAGVDFIELGVPFSDPIADGPVIQQASQQALNNGITLKKVFEIVSAVRRRSRLPIVLMGYFNPFYRFGIENALRKSREISVDGWIIPDWPLEESQKYQRQIAQSGIDLIHLIAPNTPPARIKAIDVRSKSFIYCVAYTGVTGKDNQPTPETIHFFEQLNRRITSPLMIGFGIKSHDHYLTYTRIADGVIVGSAFIQLLQNTPREEYKKTIPAFVRHIREGE